MDCLVPAAADDSLQDQAGSVAAQVHGPGPGTGGRRRAPIARDVPDRRGDRLRRHAAAQAGDREQGRLMANFYELEPGEQQRRSLASLFRYLRQYVAPYHPFLRKRYRELGIDVSRLRTLADLRGLPLV